MDVARLVLQKSSFCVMLLTSMFEWTTVRHYTEFFAPAAHARRSPALGAKRDSRQPPLVFARCEFGFEGCPLARRCERFRFAAATDFDAEAGAGSRLIFAL